MDSVNLPVLLTLICFINRHHNPKYENQVEGVGEQNISHTWTSTNFDVVINFNIVILLNLFFISSFLVPFEYQLWLFSLTRSSFPH